jgi:hypothetical protein
MNRRLLLPLLAAALLVALAAASIAMAVKPGDWTDSKRKLSISVSNDGKHISGFVWICKGTRDIRRGFPNGPGVRIRRGGRFSFKGNASTIVGGTARGGVKLRVKGRFRRVNGKRRAVGTIKAGGCGKRAKRFRAKPPVGPGQGEG